MASSRSNSRLISNSYAHQADRSAAPQNMQQQAARRSHNLLHGSMARRAPAPSSSSNTVSLASHAPILTRPDPRAQSTTSTSISDPESDIIILDSHGDYRLEMPTMPTPLPRDEARDEREMENRLIETFRKHHQQIEPGELRRTLQASLAAKVASLDRDAWMFEGDDVEVVGEEG